MTGLFGAGLAVVGRNAWGGVVQAQDSRGVSPWGMMGAGGVPPACDTWRLPTSTGQPLTIQQAQEAAERYVASLGYRNLQVVEVMEFSRNFYALVRESNTGIGALELLIDKGSGAVGPEYRPNMMWNAKYGMQAGGMMGGMMGGRTSDAMTVTPAEARQIAQRWLDTYRPAPRPSRRPMLSTAITPFTR